MVNHLRLGPCVELNEPIIHQNKDVIGTYLFCSLSEKVVVNRQLGTYHKEKVEDWPVVNTQTVPVS